MNKKELVSKLSKRTLYTQKAIKQILEGFIEVVKETVGKQERIHIQHFGTFLSQFKMQRKYKDPNTQESKMIPNRRVLKFKPSKKIRTIPEEYLC